MGGRIKRSVSSLPVRGETVLLRADLDAPVIGGVSEKALVTSSVPTIKYLLDRGNKVVIIGHLSRPHGHDKAFSLKPAAKPLANALGVPIHFVDGTTGPKVAMAIKHAPQKSAVLLENVRFDPREEQNSLAFAQELAKSTGAKYFVQDDRRAVKRTTATTVAITQALPSVAGFSVIDVWGGPGVKHLLDA